MSGRDRNCALKRTRVMTDDEIYEIMSYLTLKEKLKLSHVSEQFSFCVDQWLRREKKLKIIITFDKNERKSHSVVIIAEKTVENCSLKQLDFNTIREKFELTFRKLSNLKKLIFIFETINSQFCEWINKIFASIESMSITILRNQSWITNPNKFQIILTSFRTKATELLTHVKH
jgi:hypothetical protein